MFARLLLTFVLLRDALIDILVHPIDACNDCNTYSHFIVSLIIKYVKKIKVSNLFF